MDIAGHNGVGRKIAWCFSDAARVDIAGHNGVGRRIMNPDVLSLIVQVFVIYVILCPLMVNKKYAFFLNTFSPLLSS